MQLNTDDLIELAETGAESSKFAEIMKAIGKED